MNDELQNEIEAINSIYGDSTIGSISISAAATDYTLTIPSQDVTLRLFVPDQYPDVPLRITAVEGVGSSSRKGFGSHLLTIAQSVLARIFTPGQVCLFDLLQELEQVLQDESLVHTEQSEVCHGLEENPAPSVEDADNASERAAPSWTLSTAVTEKKSVFMARASTVESTAQAQSAVQHLLATNKRATKATHNITAYRIQTMIDGHQVVYQDCDDDGEDAAGGRLLKLLQMMDVWNVLVVVSRWYGGVKLGPARFGIINAVAREAVVKGGYYND
ncbi:MAG: hypothetical protein Q9174_004973 [Haloplaca sp. 1 TL-2023]